MGYQEPALLPGGEDFRSYTMDRIDRLIDNAVIAHDRCKQSGSTWGIDYWGIVIQTLLRRYKRIN